MGKILLSYFSLFCNISERLRSEQSLKIRFLVRQHFLTPETRVLYPSSNTGKIGKFLRIHHLVILTETE